MQMKDRDEIEQILKSLSEQIWWNECCAKVDESLVVRVHNLIPRMMNWKVVKPKPRYEDLMDDMNLTSSPQELNHLDLPNPLMFGSTDDAANVAQAVTVQQQYERTAPIEFRDEFDDFSTPPMHESEKGNPDIEEDPPQSLNEHKTDAKSNDVVDDAGQSSKVGGNEGEDEKSLKEAESSYTDKLQEDDRNSTDAEVDEAIRKERVMESKEALHNTDEDLSKVITLYVPPSRASYPTGITYIDAAAIDTCDRQVFCGNFDF
ncbi:hypothetical protein FXO37_28820 [Capsicum annuum]|nr:hypothetical protein FXO37_28820 [Capsicum annuum]